MFGTIKIFVCDLHFDSKKNINVIMSETVDNDMFQNKSLAYTS